MPPSQRDRARFALGIDVGTGSTKAGLIDPDGHLVAVGRAAHAVFETRPGWSESDPDSWLESVRSAVAKVLAHVGAQISPVEPQVAVIGFSGQMHGVVLCDEDAAPVRPAILWSDRRSLPCLDGLREQFSAVELERLANPIVAGMAGTTIAAVARVEPEVFSGVDTAVQPKDWVRRQLTGRLATDPSDASATLLWDAPADRWMERACQVFGVEERLLPPVLPSDGAGGSLDAAGAELLGLPGGTPVAVGAADTAAALLGAGIKAGETQVSIGTGGQIARLEITPHTNPESGTHLFRSAASVASGGGASSSPEPAPWYAMAAIQNAGIAIDWARGVLDMSLKEAGQAVATAPIGSSGVSFLPYLTGERTPHLDAELCGMWSGLRPTTSRADLMRSVFEGVAFALRDGLDALTATTSNRSSGHSSGPSSALLAGGGSTALWWRRMLADCLQISLIPHSATDASVRGAGLLAWSSIGNVIDPALAVSREAPVLPSADNRSAYAQARQRFVAAFAAQPGTHLADEE